MHQAEPGVAASSHLLLLPWPRRVPVLLHEAERPSQSRDGCLSDRPHTLLVEKLLTFLLVFGSEMSAEPQVRAGKQVGTIPFEPQLLNLGTPCLVQGHLLPAVEGIGLRANQQIRLGKFYFSELQRRHLRRGALRLVRDEAVGLAELLVTHHRGVRCFLLQQGWGNSCWVAGLPRSVKCCLRLLEERHVQVPLSDYLV